MRKRNLFILINFFTIILIVTLVSCKKQQGNNPGSNTPGGALKCGTLLTTPNLDSFVYPTYYITAIVAFSDGNETVHYHGNVTGDHDSSWFLPRYSKDSSICVTP